MLLNSLHISKSFSTFTGADRTDLQPVRQGYSDVPSASVFMSDNILIRNKMKRLSFEELPEVNSERWLSLEDLEGEEWKDVCEDGSYQVSNYGRVKSVDRHIQQGTSTVFRKSKILRPAKTRKGYLDNHMQINKKPVNKAVHLIVWSAFYGKPEKGYEVNHIDENKMNNTLDNLNLLTHKENVNWGTHNARMAKTISEKHRLKRAIIQYKDGVEVKRYQSMMECQRETGIYHAAISACCWGKRKTHHGYTWRFQDDINKEP